MIWKCQTCGIPHEELPTCFGIDTPPWRDMEIPESELDARVETTRDQCVVDEQHFFIRGHIEIPIHDFHEALSFSVWSSLSEQSFWHMSDRWDVAGGASLTGMLVVLPCQRWEKSLLATVLP